MCSFVSWDAGSGLVWLYLLADDESDGVLLEEIIDHVDVSEDLSDIGEVQSGGFDFDYTISMKRYDIEEEINELFDASGFKLVLAPEEGESTSK